MSRHLWRSGRLHRRLVPNPPATIPRERAARGENEGGAVVRRGPRRCEPHRELREEEKLFLLVQHPLHSARGSHPNVRMGRFLRKTFYSS